MALRAALGASRGRIVRQLLVESVLLAAIGAGARWSSRWEPGVDSQSSAPRACHASTPSRSTAKCCCSRWSWRSSPPCSSVSRRRGGCRAWTCSRISTPPAAGRRARARRGPLAGKLRRLLVTAELALAVVLLIAAGLLVRSFARLQDVPPGSIRENVLTLELSMSGGPLQRRERGARVISPDVASAERAARRHGRRRRVVAAAQPDVRLGADHRRGTYAAGRRGVHQR